MALAGAVLANERGGVADTLVLAQKRKGHVRVADGGDGLRLGS